MKKRADGRWQKAIVIDGKTRFFYSREATERKAESDIAKQIKTYRLRTEERKYQTFLFSEVSTEWERTMSESVSLSTYNRYKSYINRANDQLGDIPINEITPMDINALLVRMKRQDFAQKTISGQHNVIHMILKYALSMGLVERNVADAVIMPTSNKTPIRREALTDEEQKVVEDHSCEPFGFFLYFMMYTGLRIGEAIALTYDDIDTEEKTINVTKSVTWASGTAEIVPPKTEAGIRTVILPQCVADKLPQKHKKGFVFGDKLRYKLYYDRQLRKFCEANGVSFTFHQLRHTYATLLYEADIGQKDAQILLGHADASTTTNIYTHIRDRQRKLTATKLNDYIGTNIKQNYN